MVTGIPVAVAGHLIYGRIRNGTVTIPRIKLETESQTRETVQNQSVCFKSQPGAMYQY